MQDKVVLDGELSLMNQLDGELSLDVKLDGEGMATINVGHDPVIEHIIITENGTYDAPEGVDGYEHIEVFVPPWSDELYPVGTDIVGKYLGRNWSNGTGLFVHGTTNLTTGEFKQTDNVNHNGLCMVYIPIDPNYTYVKSDQGRCYSLCFYDENFNFVGTKRDIYITIYDGQCSLIFHLTHVICVLERIL